MNYIMPDFRRSSHKCQIKKNDVLTMVNFCLTKEVS